ncbi:hypothetical protein ACXET9_07460 [Brachybacterium sp. DNPG3]
MAVHDERPTTGPSAAPRSPVPRSASFPANHPASFAAPAPAAPAAAPRPARALEGRLLSPGSRRLAVRRRRGRWLTVGVPVTLGGGLGISTFVVLGVASLVGGAGLLIPLAAGLGVGALVGGGTGFLLRERRPAPARLDAAQSAGLEIREGTRRTLTGVVRSTRTLRRRLTRLRRRARRGTGLAAVVRRAEALLEQIDALASTAALQARRASDDDLLLVEGMASRYVPDLVRALEDTVPMLQLSSGRSHEQAAANLASIDEQLATLGARLDRVEDDLVAGVTRSLDVHAEFLRTRLAEPTSIDAGLGSGLDAGRADGPAAR